MHNGRNNQGPRPTSSRRRRRLPPTINTAYRLTTSPSSRHVSNTPQSTVHNITRVARRSTRCHHQHTKRLLTRLSMPAQRVHQRRTLTATMASREPRCDGQGGRNSHRMRRINPTRINRSNTGPMRQTSTTTPHRPRTYRRTRHPTRRHINFSNFLIFTRDQRVATATQVKAKAINRHTTVHECSS